MLKKAFLVVIGLFLFVNVVNANGIDLCKNPQIVKITSNLVNNYLQQELANSAYSNNPFDQLAAISAMGNTYEVRDTKLFRKIIENVWICQGIVYGGKDAKHMSAIDYVVYKVSLDRNGYVTVRLLQIEPLN